MKVRFFATNLSIPESDENEDVTIDIWMFKSAIGVNVPEGDPGVRALDRAPRVNIGGTTIQVGAKPILADIVRELAKKHGITPMEAQALIWAWSRDNLGDEQL